MRRRSPASELSGPPGPDVERAGVGMQSSPDPPISRQYSSTHPYGSAGGPLATGRRKRDDTKTDQSGERERSTQQQELTARDTSDATQATSRERFFEFDYSPHACNCMRVECEYCPPAGAPSSSS